MWAAGRPDLTGWHLRTLDAPVLRKSLDRRPSPRAVAWLAMSRFRFARGAAGPAGFWTLPLLVRPNRADTLTITRSDAPFRPAGVGDRTLTMPR
jgi:hypothetical protein